MNGTTAYALSKKYTADTADSLGSLKGAPCSVKSVSRSLDGKYTIVTLLWEGTSGAEEETDVKITNGEDGLGIKDAEIDENGHLIVIYDDDTRDDTGAIPVKEVEVGNVETVEYDEGAEVTATPTSDGVALNFKIPRGQSGSADPVWNII